MVSKNILLESFNQFHGVPTSPLVQMWIKTYRCLVCMNDPNLSMHHLLEHINQGDKAKIRTQQQIKLKTRAKEIRPIHPSGPENSQITQV